MPSSQTVIFLLLLWTAVSLPLAMLVGAMIKFGARDGLPSDQSDRKFGTPARARRLDLAGVESDWLAPTPELPR